MDSTTEPTSNPASDSDLAPASIFKAYDIRGIVGETLTPRIVTAIGRAIGSAAVTRGQRAVAVARDGRLSGPEFVDALSAGLQAAGCEVIDLGQVPTPVLYFATCVLDTRSGVMVTGSHNPPAYNGFKIVLDGETLSGEAIQDLRRRILEQDYHRGNGIRRNLDLLPRYLERITSDVRLARPLRVVVDCGNGVAGVAAPRLLQALGCEVHALYCEVDGRFPHHHPDPSQTENLQDLIRTVREREADLGLAFDGDGDRLGVVDGNGRIVWPDRQMMLYAADVLSRHPGAEILYDVKCSRHLGRVIEERGGRPLMWKTGHSLIKAKMKADGALLAGEMSGHVFFKERWYGFDDALYTAARLLEILSREARAPAEVFAELPDAVSTPELRVEMAEGEHFRFMERFAAEARFPEARVSTIDGIRADFPDGWGLIRPSNTTPTLIIRFEADDEAALARIQQRFREAIEQVASASGQTLELPF